MRENHILSPNLNMAFCQIIIQLRKSYAKTVLTVSVLVGPTPAPAWVFLNSIDMTNFGSLTGQGKHNKFK